MIALYFNPSKFPRTITRKEWRDIWRWKRVTEKQLAIEARAQIESLHYYGTTMPRHIRDEMLDNIINPPLLIHSRMDR